MPRNLAPEDRAELDAAREALAEGFAEFDIALARLNPPSALCEFLDACESDPVALENMLRRYGGLQ